MSLKKKWLARARVPKETLLEIFSRVSQRAHEKDQLIEEKPQKTPQTKYIKVYSTSGK